jgi:hypothetical protein
MAPIRKLLTAGRLATCCLAMSWPVADAAAQTLQSYTIASFCSGRLNHRERSGLPKAPVCSTHR